jgi:hypothetical protein
MSRDRLVQFLPTARADLAPGGLTTAAEPDPAGPVARWQRAG